MGIKMATAFDADGNEWQADVYVKGKGQPRRLNQTALISLGEPGRLKRLMQADCVGQTSDSAFTSRSSYSSSARSIIRREVGNACGDALPQQFCVILHCIPLIAKLLPGSMHDIEDACCDDCVINVERQHDEIGEA